MSNKVFVGGLDWNTTEEGLESAFGKCGEISEVKVIRDRETGRSRGFGFVTFVDSSAADRAVSEFDGTELDGRAVRVNIAEERKPRTGGGGGGGGGGGFRSGGGGGGGGGGSRGGNRW